MINILVVGSGNIGSRHIQGLVKSNKKKFIHIVETSYKSKINTIKRIKDINSNFNNYKFYENIPIINKKLNLIIISTKSGPRLKILKKILSTCTFENIILEKICFKNIKEFLEADKLLRLNKKVAYINFSRREFKFYKELKKKLNFKKTIFFQVSGNFNLGSNLVHFLDLLDFLNIKFNIKNLTTSNIKYKILDSKYLNISGNIFIQSANGVYFNFCDNNKIKDCIIKIVTEENFLEINETMQTCEIQSRKNKINLDYKYEHISDNSKVYVKKGKFIKNIDINLNTIHQSLDIHKKLFQIMKRVYKENNINKKYIIT